jgi:hypothetical protein
MLLLVFIIGGIAGYGTACLMFAISHDDEED